jgi:hypothetical protein
VLRTVWRIIFFGCLFSWLTWLSQKFPPMKINAYSIIRGAWSKTLWKHGQLFSLSISKNRYCQCHPADGVFITNIVTVLYLMLFVQISLQKWLGDQEIESTYRFHHRLCSAALLDLAILSRNLLILRAFSDFLRKLAPPKIIRHTVLTTYSPRYLLV